MHADDLWISLAASPVVNLDLDVHGVASGYFDEFYQPFGATKVGESDL